ncbi:MAG: hypothetical protein COA79_26475 [Planctomycetota bacterium]|nr:MAG: hypothetical protein COA79_26475 [Planctomycetota bacterium]
MKLFFLIILTLSGCVLQNKPKSLTKHKLCFGKYIPIEYEQKKPITIFLANSVKVGDKMSKVLRQLGVPSQDSGDTKYIWHYMVEGGTYLQVVGHEKAIEVFQYTNDDIKSQNITILASFFFGDKYKEFTDYHSNGKVKETGKRYCFNIVCGKRYYQYDGIYKTWHDNGQLQSELKFVKGEYQGLLKTWYKNGKLKYSVNWDKDKKDGAFKVYYESGEISSEGIFQKGKLKSSKFYNKSHEIISAQAWVGIKNNKKFW